VFEFAGDYGGCWATLSENGGEFLGADDFDGNNTIDSAGFSLWFV
jgi:hypothetical protein